MQISGSSCWSPTSEELDTAHDDDDGQGHDLEYSEDVLHRGCQANAEYVKEATQHCRDEKETLFVKLFQNEVLVTCSAFVKLCEILQKLCI